MKKIYIGVGFLVVIGLFLYLFWTNRALAPADQGSVTGIKTGSKSSIDTSKVNCFENTKQSDLELEYEDFGMTKYILSESIIDCLDQNYKKGFNIYIQKGDIYVDRNNKLILYKATQFTGDNILKVNGMIEIN